MKIIVEIFGKKYGKYLVWVLFLAFLAGASPVYSQSSGADSSPKTAGFQGQKAENAIIIVAGGMGLSAKTLARVLKAGPYGQLDMDKMSICGYLSTHGADGWITDQAASATAVSTGKKTNKGMVGTGPDGLPLPTLLEKALAFKMSTGIITTGRVTNPGLSPFYSSLKNKYLEDQAARDLVEKGLNVIFGGGKMSFIPSDDGGLQLDNRDWLDNASVRGYKIAKDRKAMLALGDLQAFSMGLFADGVLAYEIDRPISSQPSLAEMGVKALSILSRTRDRFMMVADSGRLADAAHDNDAPALAREILALDDLVGISMNFAERDKKTLVLLICPYEAGGPVLTQEFDAVGIEAIRASARLSAGRIDSTGANISDVFRLYGNINRLSEEEQKAVFANLDRNELPRVVGNIISRRLGVYFPDFSGVFADNYLGNTGSETLILAHGPGAERFGGFHDNSQVGSLIMEALGIY